MNMLFPLLEPVIQVDRDIPLPPPKQQFTRKYPFNIMAVGDSFFVPGMTRRPMASSIRHASCECRKFTTRRVIENGVSGLRIWRIA